MKRLNFALAALAITVAGAGSAVAGEVRDPLGWKCSAIPFDPKQADNPIAAAVDLASLSQWTIGFLNGSMYARKAEGAIGMTDRNLDSVFTALKAFCDQNPDKPAIAAVIHVHEGIFQVQ